MVIIYTNSMPTSVLMLRISIILSVCPFIIIFATSFWKLTCNTIDLSSPIGDINDLVCLLASSLPTVARALYIMPG